MLIGVLLAVTAWTGAAEAKRSCLVLADGHVSEYAWGEHAEVAFPADHPGHNFCVSGLLDYQGRFERWLTGWTVKRLDLEQHEGPLLFDGIDLVILDDVRQVVLEPYELALVEFVREGGGLVVYGGLWSLGGIAKTEFCVNEVVSSFQNSPLGQVLPVEIQNTPDMTHIETPHGERAVFLDTALGVGIDAPDWRIFQLHDCKARGEVLAQVGDKPLMCRGTLGEGRIVVYTADDLGWTRWGDYRANINPFSGTLWRRLAALAVGDAEPVQAAPDPVPGWEKPPAFAHPDQPMNFLWSGYFYYQGPEIEEALVRDLVTHSVNLIDHGPGGVSRSGVQTWVGIGCPLVTEAASKDQDAWRVDADGKPIDPATLGGLPCLNNPKALQYMDGAVARNTVGAAQDPWITYGHMGDESVFGDCYCEHCRKAFREEFGYELPTPKSDFSPEYLDQWIDYCIFKNRSVGRMYARAARVAKENDPRLKMFASIPEWAGMTIGGDMFNTQSGFDIIWNHCYPGTMAIRTGLNAQLQEETASLQGRPYLPVFNLLQDFDSYDRAPRVPPREYAREMLWQAIAHGVDSVGWFVYNAFWWTLPGTEGWDEIGRLAHDVLEPLTPTLYKMRNAPQPVGLLHCYSQEAIDGLKAQVWGDDNPWKPAVRWYAWHCTHEAYEALKFAHVPFNVVSEYRLIEGRDLPWKVIVIPYVEHLHAKSCRALQDFMARGGEVYVGANSTLDLPGIRKLPMSFDVKPNTWWPKDRPDEWDQRRYRAYFISAILEKARHLREIFAPICEDAIVTIDDPEVVYNVREAGAARYIFIINDHQVNPTSPELRKKRGQYAHFMLMPMEFPEARPTVSVKGPGYLYPLLQGSAEPIELKQAGRTPLEIELAGGAGKVFLLLPEQIVKVEFAAEPERTADGVAVKVRVLSDAGAIKGSLPLRIDMTREETTQTAYATTENGELSWTVPFLREFAGGPISVTVTDLASGKTDRKRTHSESPGEHYVGRRER
jgi:hypothetical protein